MAGAAAGLGLLPSAALARERFNALEWRGPALGTEAHLILHHDSRARAQRIVEAIVAEIHRLEHEFSLFRPDSALSRLNRHGTLRRPSLDMQRVLRIAIAVGAASDGAFDVSIQPLWDLYARWFGGAAPRTDVPPPAKLEAAAALINYRDIEVGPAAIRLARPSMALTLNGVAQGYIADRVVEILRNGGFDHALVDAGEFRAMSSRADGRPWCVRLDHPDDAGSIVELTDVAVATSSGFRARFTPDGLLNHLLDPRSGRSPDPLKAVSVIAPTATLADALSTALCLMPEERGVELLRRFGSASVLFSGNRLGDCRPRFQGEPAQRSPPASQIVNRTTANYADIVIST